jgi:serine/threonine protein kinase
MPAAGSRLGPYEIVAPLGAGGMGEVFRARDTRIDRAVALKLLPAEWAQDPDRLRRFEQEARTVGALSHPNLLTLHDVGTTDGVPYLVTELLEGESLRDRLRGGALPTRKAVDIACQIARGLAAAHERGIVHRDLKPDNVFITRDGHVKILDFGLARLWTPAGSSTDAGDGETRVVTDIGVVVGTAGYSSPEQARAQPLDARSDIFSFGAVLYEMLSGRRAFGGTSAVDAMTAVVRDDPPDLTGPAVSPALNYVVRRCIEKQPGERYQSARDVAFALEAVTSGSGSSRTDAQATKFARSPRWLPLAVIGLAMAAAGAGATYVLISPASESTAVLRYETYSGFDSSPAVSPDGKTLAFTSTRDGRQRIWLKQLIGSSEAALTDGTDSLPRFHPDGASVLFIRRDGDQTSLFRQRLLGGDPRRLASGVEEADWSPDGKQLVLLRRSRHAATVRSVISLAAADGSGVRDLATHDIILTHPRWSPDGRQIAAAEFGVQSGSPRRLVLMSASDGATQLVEPGLSRRRLSAPVWTADSRQLVYAQAESVTADTSGSPARIFLHDLSSDSKRMLLWSPMMADVVDIAADGALIWDGTSARSNLRAIPLTRDPASARWLTRGQSNDRQPVFTRDGQWVVFSSTRSGNLDLWALSPATGAIRRITDDAADDWDPGVTSDGRLVWSSGRSGHFEIWTANFDGSEARQISNDGADAENPTVAPDGWVVYNSAHPTKYGLWKVRLDGTKALRLTQARVLVPDVSPDGQYVAATERPQSSQVRILVWRLSDGARVPFEILLHTDELTFGVGRVRWVPDGKRLAFLGLDERGVRGVYVQDFAPDRDTRSTRQRLVAFDTETRTESFCISPDGTQLVVTGTDQLRTIVRADGVPGIRRAVPAGK